MNDRFRGNKKLPYETMDEISQRFGKHALHLGGSHVIEVLGKGMEKERINGQREHSILR